MRLYRKVYGDGPPVIILHGLLGSSNNWSTLARTLGDRFRVYAVDQRNHGRSPHSAVMDYPSMAADIHELMEEEHIASSYLLGHSMGGKTAMEFALAYPDRTRGLVVADMAPRAYPPGHDAILDAMTDADPSSFQSREEANAALAEGVPDSTVRQFLLTNLSRKDGSGFRWKVNLKAIRDNYDAVLAAVSPGRVYEGPVLFLSGARSGYITPDDRLAIVRMFPRAKVEVIAGAGHWLHAEAPEEFARRVTEFLVEHS